MRKFVRAMCHPGAQSAIGSIMVLLLTIALIACGDDSGTSANDDDSSSSSVTLSGTSVESNGSKASSSSKKAESSSSQKIASSSSTPRNDVKSSSSNKALSSSSKRSEGDPSSSSQKAVSSSSSVIPASSGNLPSSSSKKNGESSSAMTSSSSSSKKIESSSSEYVPFDHSKTHAASWEIGENRYKTFVDPRNGRSYYYITITSSKTGKSVTVMAENLNIGEMVLGENNQSDDTKIERYCYNNDTTKCDEFGGLYQWAEMMQLPSRCNTESCADLIQENHRGICPEGWRLFTWDDYVVVRGYEDKYNDGVKGLRSMYGFRGTNQSGFSLTGAGLRIENGTFSGLEEKIAFFRPEEYEADASVRAHHGIIDVYGFSPEKQHRELKVKGFSVRCVKLE